MTDHSAERPFQRSVKSNHPPPPLSSRSKLPLPTAALAMRPTLLRCVCAATNAGNKRNEALTDQGQGV